MRMLVIAGTDILSVGSDITKQHYLLGEFHAPGEAWQRWDKGGILTNPGFKALSLLVISGKKGAEFRH